MQAKGTGRISWRKLLMQYFLPTTLVGVLGVLSTLLATVYGERDKQRDFNGARLLNARTSDESGRPAVSDGWIHVAWAHVRPSTERC